MEDEKSLFQPSTNDLQHLREWLAKSPHIIQDYDDKVLSAFVRGCERSLQKAKKILEGFNSVGKRYPQIIKNYDPLDQRLIDHLSQLLQFTLPKKTPDGSIIYMGLLRHSEGFKNDPYKSHFEDFFRYWFLSLYIYLWKNDFGLGKWIIVSDCKHSTLIHSRDVTPILIRQMLEMLEKDLPIKIEALHLINLPSFMEYGFNFVKSFGGKIFSDRIHLHSRMETLYEKIPKEILPKEYGGNEESVYTLHDRWYETVKSYRKEFLEEESKMRKLDPLRPKTEDADEMVGTFKSLNVD